MPGLVGFHSAAERHPLVAHLPALALGSFIEGPHISHMIGKVWLGESSGLVFEPYPPCPHLALYWPMGCCVVKTPGGGRGGIIWGGTPTSSSSARGGVST